MVRRIFVIKCSPIEFVHNVFIIICSVSKKCLYFRIHVSRMDISININTESVCNNPWLFWMFHCDCWVEVLFFYIFHWVNMFGVVLHQTISTKCFFCSFLIDCFIGKAQKFHLVITHIPYCFRYKVFYFLFYIDAIIIIYGCIKACPGILELIHDLIQFFTAGFYIFKSRRLIGNSIVIFILMEISITNFFK